MKSDSSIKNVADLKGKKVGVAKAAGAHYLLLKSVEKAGLKWRDIDVAYLQPADGCAAFESDAIDAWVIWEPFVSAAESKGARIVVDGNYADVGYRRFYLTSTDYLKRRPDVLDVVVAELRKAGEWVKANPKEAAAFHGPLVNLDAATTEVVNGRSSYYVRAVDDIAYGEQQKIADAFTSQSLLPRKLQVLDIPAWSPAKK